MRTQDLLLEKGLPSNLDAERFILGSILLDGSRWPLIAGSISMREFTLESHRRIWRACMDQDESAQPIDRVTVANRLKERGELESVGGVTYLVELDEGMPHIPNLDGYVTILRDSRVKRDLIRAARRIEEMVLLETFDVSTATERAIEFLTGVSDEAERGKSFRSIAEIISDNGGINGWMAGRNSAGMLTGYSDLDKTTGGLGASDLWVIAGSTGGGKSTFTRNLALQMASAGYPGAIVSLEMGEEQVVDGMLAIPSDLRISDLRKGYISDRPAFREAMVLVNDQPIHVDCRAMTLPAVRAGIMRLRQRGGCRWLIVDFVQLMQSVSRSGNREQEVAGIIYGLKRIAIELQIGIIALSQLSREHTKLKRKPELSDLRESGAIEQAANLVAFVWSEFQEVAMDEYPAELLIRKQRSGEGHVDILFGWKKSCGRFTERGRA